MPYTPPAAQSPVACNVQTPPLRRSQPYSSTQVQSNASRPCEPKPATPISDNSSRGYLHKHRRSPSISSSPPTRPTTQGRQSVELDDVGPKPEQPEHRDARLTGRQDETHPTCSSSNSSEDEANVAGGRGRHLENLAELQAAIRSMEQKRSGSPTEQEEARQTRVALGLELPSGGLTDKAKTVELTLPQRPPLTAEARKISHSRSNTETAILDFAQNDSTAKVSAEGGFEVVDDIEIGKRPPLLRKKSGEPIRPALRPTSAGGKRRPSSMPGTPTYGKAVHFDNHLEHVRTFLQVDRPLAVSAGSSPVDNHESESEFPFSRASRTPRYECEISLPNFPTQRPEKAGVPVRMEKIYLSTDNRSLLGLVAVQNLAFHKMVVARFTFDYWQTTSEVKADYSKDVRRRQLKDGYDRFIFNIKTAEQANLEKKTMFLCIRYSVNGHDFWDNNGSTNYQIDFSKKPCLQNGKGGVQGAPGRPLQSLPRDSPSGLTTARPRSFPSIADDFASSAQKSFEFSSFPPQSARSGGEPSTKFRKPETEIVPHLPIRRSSGAGQAFGNRYDFGASLSAAMQAANDKLGDRSGLPTQPEQTSKNNKQSSTAHNAADSPTSSLPASQTKVENAVQESTKAGNGVAPHAAADLSTPSAITAEKAPIQSSSYHELLNKYCFFGSSKPSIPIAAPTPKQGSSHNPRKPETTKTEQDGATAAPSVHKKPTLEDDHSANRMRSSQHTPRSVSPASALGSRASSPVAYGYPYPQPMNNGLFKEAHTPTAILG